MGAPFTQVEIQTEIDFYKTKMQTATNLQSYSAESVSIAKANLDSIQNALKFWLDLMSQYYPDAYAQQPKIEFNEIGFLSG